MTSTESLPDGIAVWRNRRVWIVRIPAFTEANRSLSERYHTFPSRAKALTFAAAQDTSPITFGIRLRGMAPVPGKPGRYA